jgi:hypothetical protein
MVIKSRFTPSVAARIDLRRESEGLWLEYLKWVLKYPSPIFVFRGQEQKWPLKPSIGRSSKYRPEKELQLLREFQRLSHLQRESNRILSDWDLLFLAQHHGLPTRLLDWTTNPLVAAFFATKPSARGKQDGEIIAMSPRRKGFYEPHRSDETPPFEIRENRFVYPTVLANRITSQKGLFSVHAEPNKPWRLPGQTVRFTIPAENKALFRRYLFSAGVDDALIKADLDGISATLKWQYEGGIALR